MDKEKPKVFDYVSSSSGGHLPFPEEGDTIWFGDTMFKVVSRETEDRQDLKKKSDGPYKRYMEFRIVVSDG